MAMSEKMKKRLKKELIEGIICIIVLFGAYCGCEMYIDKQVEEWNSVEYIGISNKTTYNNEVYFKTVEEFEDYEYTSDFYSSEIYYKELNAQEKFVYDAFKYAYENNITHLFFEESLISECKYSLYEILQMFALDSPVMEQNIVFGEDEGSYTIDNQFLYKTVERELKGSYINVENFTEERAQKKKKAIKKAGEIEFNFTEDMTDYEKAKEIYNYLGENVVYKNKEKKVMKCNYLYDALCKGKTNCDGFANAFSLLCSMHGLTNFEKMDDPEKEEEGHTWNAVLLDGKWYNIDATCAPDVLDDDWLKDAYIRFGFSDKIQTQKPILSALTPECEIDMIPIGCQLKSCDDESAVRKIAEAYRDCDEDIFVVTIKKADEDEINDLMQDVAYYLYEGFQTSTVDGQTKQIVYVKK